MSRGIKTQNTRIAPHRPREIEQINDANKLEQLKRDRAHVQDGGQAQGAGEQVGDDSCRAAARSSDAGTPAQEQAI